MSWFGQGFSSMENAYDNVPGKESGPKRVWIPPEQTKQFIFLDDDPVTYWEHQFKYGGNWRNWRPCVTHNGFGPECPICEAYEDRYPYFVGLFSVIEMTPFFTKKTQEEINYTRKIFPAKKGGKEKPGVLKKLERLKGKHGRLKGLVFDVHRSGKKTESVGDEFELVEKVDPDKIEEYGKKLLGEYVPRRNKKAPPDRQVTVESIWERHPWVPFDFEADGILKEPDVAELKAMFANMPSGGGGSGSDNSGDRSDFKDDDGDGVDDDIPY